MPPASPRIATLQKQHSVTYSLPAPGTLPHPSPALSSPVCDMLSYCITEVNLSKNNLFNNEEIFQVSV